MLLTSTYRFFEEFYSISMSLKQADSESEMENIQFGVNSHNIRIENLPQQSQAWWQKQTKVIAVCTRPTKEMWTKNNPLRKIYDECFKVAGKDFPPFTKKDNKMIYSIHFVPANGIGQFNAEDEFETKETTPLQTLMHECGLKYLESKKTNQCNKFKMQNPIILAKPVQYRGLQPQGWQLMQAKTITQVVIDKNVIQLLPEEAQKKICWWVSIAVKPRPHHSLMYGIKTDEMRVQNNKYMNFATDVCCVIFTKILYFSK